MSEKAIDREKANAVINEYIACISDPDKLPGVHGRTWMEFCMERHGLIKDVRALKFGESHALWYACLILTKRIGEVCKAENAVRLKGNRTRSTLRKLRTGTLRTSATGLILEKLLEEPK